MVGSQHNPKSQDRHTSSPDRLHMTKRMNPRSPDRDRNQSRDENRGTDRSRFQPRETEHDRRVGGRPRPRGISRGLSPQRSAVTKTKHERNNNPSSRIHSLKNLLGRSANLPMTIRQEKERELAALLLEQTKNREAQSGKKNLQKYHFVRFIERQKAERLLKKLLQQQSDEQGQNKVYRQGLETQIHELEVDINYAKYAPLTEKYISLYAEPSKHKSKQPTHKAERRVLDTEEKEELVDLKNDQGDGSNSTAGAKPPLWQRIEKYMLEGEAKLEALRDGKLKPRRKLDKELTIRDGKVDRASRSAESSLTAEKTAQLDEGGRKDRMDFDDDDDENMIDGGFFER